MHGPRGCEIELCFQLSLLDIKMNPVACMELEVWQIPKARSRAIGPNDPPCFEILPILQEGLLIQLQTPESSQQVIEPQLNLGLVH